MDGGVISWTSHKQELVILSTVKAEYVAATHAVKEAVWLRRFISEVFLPLSKLMILHCDNQAAISLAANANYHARTKHIDIHYYFIRSMLENGSIHLVYCPSDDMTADILTKPLPIAKIKCHVSSLGLHAT